MLDRLTQHMPLYLYSIKEICIISKRLKQIQLTVNIYHTIFLIRNSQKIQKYSDRQKSTSPVSNFVLKTCVQFESNPLKTVGGDRF